MNIELNSHIYMSLPASTGVRHPSSLNICPLLSCVRCRFVTTHLFFLCLLVWFGCWLFQVERFRSSITIEQVCVTDVFGASSDFQLDSESYGMIDMFFIRVKT